MGPRSASLRPAGTGSNSGGSVGQRSPAKVSLNVIPASKDFRLWLGQKLAKRNVVELLRAWDKSGDNHISHDEFRRQVALLGFEGTPSDLDDFIRSVDTDGSGHVSLSELRDPMKKIIDEAVQHDKGTVRRKSQAAIVSQKDSAIIFLEARKKHLMELCKQGVELGAKPPTAHNIAHRLSGRLEQFNSLAELKRLWDK